MEATKLDSTPIKEISMQTPPGFMVRAWVLRKVESEVTKDGRPVKRTTLYLEDETGKIIAVGFGNGVAARCEEVKELTVYEVSGVHVFEDNPNKRFRAVSKFSLELTQETTIKPLKKVQRQYNFVDIASLQKERDLFDVLGVITNVYDPIDCGTNLTKKKRRIVLMDSSNASVVLTLWKNMVDFPVEVGSVLAVQLAYIDGRYGVKLDTCEWTCLEVVGPEHPEAAKARELLEWYQRRDHDSAPPTEISQSGEPLLP